VSDHTTVYKELILRAWVDAHLPDPLRRQLARIYAASFPATGRVDIAVLLAGADLAQGLLCTAERRGALVGFTYSSPVVGTDVHLLGYVAVDPAHRARGIGSHLVTFLRHLAATTGTPSGFLVELEPVPAPSHCVGGSPRTPLHFYEHVGARRVDCLPDFEVVDSTVDASPRTRLLWLPTGNPEHPARLDGPRLRQSVETILTRAHGLDPRDPRLAKILESLAC